MSSRPSSTTSEMLRLYSLAAHGEYNLARFFDEHPDLVAHLDVSIDLARDDVEIALQLAPVIGRHKKRALRLRAGEQAERTATAVRQLVATSHRHGDGIELDADVLLGALLADSSKKYISFELPGARVPVLRAALAKARVPLRTFIDVTAYVDGQGLHLRWRGGRGGLNLRARVEERGAEVLHVDLRPAPPVRRTLPHPVHLADVLAELGLI